MSEQADQSDKPNRSNRRPVYAMVGLMVVGAVLTIVRGRKVDDAALEQALVGTWTAVDPSDATLHRRELPVSHEQFVFGTDGTLTHIIELASKPGDPEKDLWAWKVSKGRLYVRFLGEDAGGQWLPGFPFSVSDKTMSIRVKNHAPKKWVRR